MNNNSADDELPDQAEFICAQFNEEWERWFAELQMQMPNLHQQFDNVLMLIETASQMYPHSLIRAFINATEPRLGMLCSGNPAFLQQLIEIANQSNHKLMPEGLMNEFNRLSVSQKEKIYQELRSFARKAAEFDEALESQSTGYADAVKSFGV